MTSQNSGTTMWIILGASECMHAQDRLSDRHRGVMKCRIIRGFSPLLLLRCGGACNRSEALGAGTKRGF